jgi:glucuronate isomerase
MHPDRLFPTDPGVRRLARSIYSAVRDAPIISPHGHVDPALLAEDASFTDPSALFVTPDHYVTRMLHALGVNLARLVSRQVRDDHRALSPREVWRLFCEHWVSFRGTPSRYWIESELVDVFGVSVQPAPETADALYDELVAKLARPEFRPRALFQRFRLEVMATTDDPCSDLADHRSLAADPTWTGRVVPTFRPDQYLDPAADDWPRRVESLGAAAGADTGDYEGYIDALERRRAFFAEHGATSTDHGPVDAESEPLSSAEARRIYTAALTRSATLSECTAFRRHMLGEMARMACDDGLVMQLHSGVLRNHHPPTYAAYGPDMGHDIPVAAEFTRALRPLLGRYGTHPRFRLVIFTVDETTWSRELAPLAGFYPSVFVGAPWWFLDTPGALLRFREAVTDTAGFYKTSGFVDDTRAFCSIPARHDTARRVDCGYLARLVAAHRLAEDEAVETAHALAYQLPRDVFRLA